MFLFRRGRGKYYQSMFVTQIWGCLVVQVGFVVDEIHRGLILPQWNEYIVTYMYSLCDIWEFSLSRVLYQSVTPFVIFMRILLIERLISECGSICYIHGLKWITRVQLKNLSSLRTIIYGVSYFFPTLVTSLILATTRTVTWKFTKK